jgi:hypothetical protein
MRDQFPERVQKVVRERLNLRGGVQLLAVRPRNVKAPINNDAVDFERRPAPLLGLCQGPVRSGANRNIVESAIT